MDRKPNIGIGIIGMEQSGKSTLSNHYLRRKRPMIIVNPGWDQKGIPINIDNGFSVRGKGNIKKEKLPGFLTKVNAPLLLELPNLDSQKSIDSFFVSLSHFSGGGIILFDDCRDLFYNTPKKARAFIRRKNHIVTYGRRGVDMLFVFHSFAQSSPEVLNLCRYLAVFQSFGDPRTGDKYRDAIISKVQIELRGKPRYTFAFIDMVNFEYSFNKLNLKK